MKVKEKKESINKLIKEYGYTKNQAIKMYRAYKKIAKKLQNKQKEKTVKECAEEYLNSYYSY